MMSREWVKDTREAWARAANEALRRAGQGERIDRRSHGRAARRGGAGRRPGAGGGESQAQCPPRPEAYQAGDLEPAKAGFWLRSDRVEQESGASAGAGRPHRADQGEDRGDLSGASGAPGAAPEHFMDNEDTRVPTVHIEIGGPMIDDTQMEHWGRSNGQYRPDSS